MLEELGEPYEEVVLPYGPQMKSPEFRAISPMGKVPALTFGSVVVTETAAICAWLADAFPQAGLAPLPGDPLRADYLRWMFFAAGPYEQSMTLQSLKADYSGEQAGFVGTVPMAEIADILDARIAGRTWLLGDRLSALDVYLGAQLSWGVMFKMLPERENIGAYVERLTGREAWKRAEAKDNALAAAAAAGA
jgi:glutathione S-transferase